MSLSCTQEDPEKQPLLSATKNSFLRSDSCLPSPTNFTTSDNLYGFVLIGLSTIGFAGMSLFIRIATSVYDIHPSVCVFIRGVVHTILLTIATFLMVGIRKSLEPFDNRQTFILFLRSVSGALNLVFMYKSLERLPLGECQTIYFSNSIMIMILSYLFLNENFTKLDMVAAMTSIIGIGLVAYPSSDKFDKISSVTRIIGSAQAIFAAFWSAVSFVSIRGMSPDVHYIVNVLSYGIATLVVGISFGGTLKLDLIVDNSVGVFIAFMSALFSLAGQCLLTKGLQHCNAGHGGLLRTLDVPILYALGLIFLNEIPSIIRLLGSILVLSSTLGIGFNRISR